ncbi:ATP-binding cassette domain-containing protein [Desulfoprunum benzoelyticum]|uniref:Molybdate transport system ATP-binding protein n=1 Tax=Desulfoprunum benzoelyticum TaxID=1506996 RepID=A0A840UQS6_9BACT|nr:ATP-binding cassette domain-containing protein [Desulfoprunum benzoelyticum]MBB5348142.1 molybdate transport system ATP-binding protein [Desulfoprunum benzoelyticum]MBM9530248.1 ATP-binding cassette domain-containing protein [Desulfoprunum benzoelyticum]
MQISNLSSPSLKITDFSTLPDQSWCIYGANDSGIEEFFAILTGDVTPTAEVLSLPEAPGIISFKIQQDIYENELRNDDSDFLDHLDPGTPAIAFLPPGSDRSPLLAALAMTDSLNEGYRQLSSGQSRKLILLREILKGARHLLLQNPYDGLDQAGCLELDKALAALHRHQVQVLVTVNNSEDIPAWCSHLAILHQGRIVAQGKREDVINQIDTVQSAAKGAFQAVLDTLGVTPTPPGNPAEELVNLKDGFARYGQHLLFEHLDLRIDTGCHTLVTGPNGSGKSTLLHMITGDNPKCYANDLRIFGIQRGSGESIWELKRDMGIVSPDLHRNYRAPGTTRQVVLSGLFDSIGLYRRPTGVQEQRAMQWLEWTGLAGRASQPFRRLSFAEQRLVLIARALIKLPRLLILDEPTQGLDGHNRAGLLQFLEQIAANRISTILYVSHRQDEYRPFFRQHIRLGTAGPSAPMP